MGRKMTANRCGTNAGYQAHIRHNEPTCKPCRDATAEYMRFYRARTGRTKYRLVRIEAKASA